MARPKIGIFGALVAVGGMLAWRWALKHRASQARLANELNRWEEEGGAMSASAQSAPHAGQEATPHDVVPNGAGRVGGTRDAWTFPHGNA